jgi:hypothetical protein
MVTVAWVLFLSVVSFLLVHELDAIRQREWQFFFAPLPVSDETVVRIFTAVHAPLFVVVLGSLEFPTAQVVVDTFAIIHAGVHFGLRNHPLVAFGGLFSRFWIYGGALVGSLHLVLVL